MKLNKIILSLLLACSFSYGETIKDRINFWENQKKSDLEKIKSLKNPNTFLNEKNSDYRNFLDNKISATKFISEIHSSDFNTHSTNLGFDYTSDNQGYKSIRIEGTWEDFFNNNPNLEYNKIRTKFELSRFGVYPNGYKDKEFRNVSIHKDFNNEGYYYIVNGYVARIDEKGVFITIPSHPLELKHTKLTETDSSTIDTRIFNYPADEVYIENLPANTYTYIKNFLKDYYKQYPVASFVIKGNGLYQKDIPKGIYISGKAYKNFRD